MPTIEQIRAARALLGWSQSDLADHADLSQTGIARIENGTNQPNSRTLDKIRKAFDRADIEFLDTSGVRKRTAQIKRLSGTRGLQEFMNDVYATAKAHGGIICLYNAAPRKWLEWIDKDFYEDYSKKMAGLYPSISMKITTKEGNTDFFSNGHAEYRWVPASLYGSDEQCFYSYGDKIALINFQHNNVEILVLQSDEFAESLKTLFMLAWDHIARTPDVTDIETLKDVG